MATQATITDAFVKINGLRIHYLDWGNPSAPTLIMLHGLRSYAHGWDGVARDFADRYHILALDQRGRGESDWDPQASYYTDTYVSDLEQLVQQLGLDRFILVGHSMGGANTLVYSSRHPEQVIAAIVEDMGPSGDTPSSGAERISKEIEATPREFSSWAEAEAFWHGQRPSISQEAMQTRLANTLKERSDGRIVWKYDLDGIARARGGADAPRVDLWPHVRALQCPTLVLRGELSDILSRETAEAMVQVNPKVRWVEIPGATHFVHEDNLPAYNREVARFLDEIS